MNHQDMPEDTRCEVLKRWITDTGFDASTLRPASADASFRRYFRFENAPSAYIVMDAPPSHNDNAPFIDISHRLFDAGLHVPRIIEHDLDSGFILISDLGSTHYLDSLDDTTVDQLYGDAISAIVQMQIKARTQGLSIYDETALRTEMNLLPDWYVSKHKNFSLNTQQQNILDNVFRLCIESALEQPSAFVHRDYHSRNLMVTSDNNPGILDYQDAVLGPITYDLVSLLKDCYISWPEEKVSGFLVSFHLQLQQQKVTTSNIDTFTRWFDLMGLQRHIKVLGIFCRLSYRDGKTAYMNDLPLVYHYIKQVCEKYPELSAFRQLLIDIGGVKGL